MSRSGKPFDESQYLASRGPELLTKLQATMTRARLVHAELLDIVTALEQDGIAALTGYSKLRNLIAETLHLAPSQAGRLVKQADQVAERLTPTGHTTPAKLPNVQAALHEGLIDGEHIEAIADTMQAIPTDADLATRELVESTLAESARTLDPKTIAAHGKEILRHLDPDGTEPGAEDKLAEPKNLLSTKRDRAGRMKFAGELEPEVAELFEKLLDKGSLPQPPDDPRTKRERMGDAFSEIVHRAANPRGGAKAQLTLYLNLNMLTNAVGTATLESGCRLSASAVRRLSCDAHIIPMVLNGRSMPLDVGHTRRLVTASQRKALIARDKGCAYPGCCNPARWADAHHLRHWADGGLTNLDNLVLLCRRHHRTVHHSAWEVRMNQGFPEFIPPTWIDPLRKPLRNTVHLRP